jgi:hypothetical protein
MSDKYSMRLEKYRAEKMDREKKRADKKAKQERNRQLIEQWRREQKKRKQDEENAQFMRDNPHLFCVTQKPSAAKCYACGDIAQSEFESKPVCHDCYQELRHGVIKNVNIHLFGGRAGVFHEDEEDPGFENGVKALEDWFNE